VTGAATLNIDLEKVTANTRAVVAALGGVEVVAVTKVTCGSPEVGRAMLDGGAVALGESRLQNAERHRVAGITAPMWLLRSPTPDQAGETVRLTDVSLNSEMETVVGLDAAAGRSGKGHGVVAMVDLGDLREGVLPADLPAFVERIESLPHLDLVGIGVNLTCYGAIVPSDENLGQLVDLARRTEAQIGRPLACVSGGNSGSIGMVVSDRMPAGVTSLRVGETILLGVDTLTREPTLDLHTDAFVLSAAVIECKVKPSLPTGTIAQDAFGTAPRFVDRGERLRAIVALGRQDVIAENLRPTAAGVEILGASSDHLILDVHDADPAPRVGDELRFVPGYGALLQAFTSPYVHKLFTSAKPANDHKVFTSA
jgi:ornithine racemase